MEPELEPEPYSPLIMPPEEEEEPPYMLLPMLLLLGEICKLSKNRKEEEGDASSY